MTLLIVFPDIVKAGSYVTLYISYDTRNVNSVSYDMDSRNSLSQ